MVYYGNNCKEKESLKKGENLVKVWSRSSLSSPKKECTKFKLMLKTTKKATLSEKIKECGRDSKNYINLCQIS